MQKNNYKIHFIRKIQNKKTMHLQEIIQKNLYEKFMFANVVKRIVAYMLIGCLISGLYGTGYVAFARENTKTLDPDPELRRHQVDYNYDYEGEGATGSTVASTGIVKSPFTKSTYRHASKFKNYQVANGIDVSEWQGNINWSQVRKSGVEYAIIRVGYRGSDSGSLRPDSRYMGYIKGALKAGIKVGVYIYSQATTPAEARAEANFVLSRIKGYDISMPVVLDYEFYTSTSGRLYKAHLTKREATDVCKAFCTTVENAGYTPMVYGNCDMMNNHLYGEELAANTLIWLANFGANNGKDRGFATSYQGTYSFWQYTSRGHVGGIGGNVDCNFWYKTSEITKKKIVSTGIRITDEEVTLTTNNKLYLYHSLEPAGCVDDITWSSSKPSVAYVKDGYVYGISGGETTITATTSTGATDSCKVVVSENMNNYAISCAKSQTYTAGELKPDVKVVSKKKMADTGITLKKTDMFAGPADSFVLQTTLKKGVKLTLYGESEKYYAVSYQTKDKTYYGYCLKKQVKVTKKKKYLVQDRDYTVKYSENKNVGTALVEVSGAEKGIYSGTISEIFSIQTESITNAIVQQISDQTVVGIASTPEVNVYYKGDKLIAGTDYTVQYQNNVAAQGQNIETNTMQSAQAIITGTGNYNGQVTVSYGVGDSMIQGIDEIPPQTFTGNAVTPRVTVRNKQGEVLTEQVDYTVAYENNVLPGSAKVTVQMMGNYTGSYCAYFAILPQDLSQAQIVVTGTYTYNQKPQTCNAIVTQQGVILREGVDYQCEYENNCCAGQATFRIRGIGNYKGSKETTYEIQPATLSQAQVEKMSTQAYTAANISPFMMITDQSTWLLRGTDYQVSFQNNKNIGKASAYLTGIGNYTGQKKLSFSIVKKKISKCKIAKIGNRKYKGKKICPPITIRNNGKKMKKGRDYTVHYGKNRAVGKATVTIKGKGKYTGKKTISFRIVK